MGIWRGKKGSTIFYYNKNSNNAQKQAMRERVYEVSNPQSNGQATQRMRLLPAQRVLGVLRPIISRSWQGVEYGQKSTQEFLRRALSMSEGYPYVDRDSSQVVPGKYQISKGTLPTIGLSLRQASWVSTINLGSPETFPTTIGELSAAILDNNTEFNPGDQITIIGCTVENTDVQENDQFFWAYSSFILDRLNTESSETIWTSVYEVGTVSGFLMLDPADTGLFAVAMIHSRLGDTGTYMRSTQFLQLDETNLAPWFAAAQMGAARRSYQKKQRTTNNTNWPVEEFDDYSSTNEGTYGITGLGGDYAGFNGKNAKVRRYIETGELAAVYVGTHLSESGFAVDEAGHVLTVTDAQGGVNALPVTAVPALANLPQIRV